MKRKFVAGFITVAVILSMSAVYAGAESEEVSGGSVETEKEDTSDTSSEALTVDEESGTIMVRAVATGNTESSIHLLVNEEGSNSKAAFFTTKAASKDFYDALVELGGVPGNNIALDDSDGMILGSGMDVKITVDGTEYDPYDLISASEKREMDARFGGNVATNQELGTGCIICTESCPAGIASDAAYQFKEPIEFVPSDSMPEKGTEVTFLFTLDDTAMVVNEAAGTVSLNAEATGYTESTIHAIVSKDGSNAKAAMFVTNTLTKDFYDALKKLGAEDGNNIMLDDADGTIEGTALEVSAEIGTDNYPFADLVTASEPREMDMRFGGNVDVNQELGTGCVMCLESCPAGITSDAAYQFKEKMEFGPSDKMPEAGKHIIVTFAVKKR